MGDERLREDLRLEGADEEHAARLREALRRGTLDENRIRAAAALGSVPARAVIPAVTWDLNQVKEAVQLDRTILRAWSRLGCPLDESDRMDPVAFALWRVDFVYPKTMARHGARLVQCRVADALQPGTALRCLEATLYALTALPPNEPYRHLWRTLANWTLERISNAEFMDEVAKGWLSLGLPDDPNSHLANGFRSLGLFVTEDLPRDQLNPKDTFFRFHVALTRAFQRENPKSQEEPYARVLTDHVIPWLLGADSLPARLEA